MAVRSRRLFGTSTVTGAVKTTVYTVPAGRTARFSLVSIVTTGTGTGLVLLRVNSTTGNPIYTIGGSGSVQNVQVLAGMVLNPGDTLVVDAPANVTVLITGYGSLLLGEPE